MHSWKKSFSALWAAEFLAIVGFSTSNPIIPLYLRDLGVTATADLNWWTGAINAAPAIALAIFAPIWGSLADSYGRKLMLLRAMIGGSFLMGLLAITTAPWQILVIKILQGCVTGTVAAATVLTASIVPEAEAGYRLGLLQMGIFLGGAVGPLFGGVVTDLAGSRINFLATALLLGAAAFVVSRGVEESFAPSPRPGSFLKKALPDLGILAGTPALVSLFCVVFCVQLSNGTANPIMPLLVLDMTKGQPGVGSISGLILGCSALAGALAAGIVGKVSARLGYSRAIVICLAGAALFNIPQAFARTPFALLGLRILSEFCLGGTMPSVNALIARICAPGKQGSTYGLSSSVSSVGASLGLRVLLCLLRDELHPGHGGGRGIYRGPREQGRRIRGGRGGRRRRPRRRRSRGCGRILSAGPRGPVPARSRPSPWPPRPSPWSSWPGPPWGSRPARGSASSSASRGRPWPRDRASLPSRRSAQSGPGARTRSPRSSWRP
jgi:DHA1 family multidrug resistance protein-like MFS transporter